MKLIKIDFYLDWPESIKVNNLRRFIIKNLMKKGEVIRWAIVDIKSIVNSSEKNKN